MSKEERYAEHTVAWELPKCDSVTKGNYNLADIETKYTPIQTEVVSDGKDKQISDLEAKLAFIEEENKINKKDADHYFDEYKLCKQQLAEKEREIEKVQQYNDRLAQGIYHSYGEHFISKVNQDKISFAVEQLEKVKEFVKETSGMVGHEWRIDRFRVLDNIDNQIKALKEGK